MLSFRGKTVSSKTFDFARDQRGTKKEKTITPARYGWRLFYVSIFKRSLYVSYAPFCAFSKTLIAIFSPLLKIKYARQTVIKVNTTIIILNQPSSAISSNIEMPKNIKMRENTTKLDKFQSSTEYHLVVEGIIFPVL